MVSRPLPAKGEGPNGGVHQNPHPRRLRSTL
jgi:hypothetical protein